jgi:hypothetical protein
MDAYLATYVDGVMADQDYQNGIFSPTLYERIVNIFSRR